MCASWHARLLIAACWFGRISQAQTAPQLPATSAHGPQTISSAPSIVASASNEASSEVAAPVLTKAPQIVKFVEAPFPDTAPVEQTDAVVILDLLLDEHGNVLDARVSQSAGSAFDAAAIEAARQFTFTPAQIDDQPAPIRIQYRYGFHREPVLPETSAIRGTVRDRTTGSNLADITVALDTGERVKTDATGRFEFSNVPPGEHSLILSGPNMAALQTAEHVHAGKSIEVTYDISPQIITPEQTASGDIDDLEILIVAPKVTAEVLATRVEAASAKRVAGTQGDVLKVVENMPGVARAAVGSGDVVVWGAGPNDTRVYVDNVRIPALYHFGGFRSVVHSDLVRSVELVPGAYSASYGRGLGGLITVATNDPMAHDVRASAQVDVLDASAFVGASRGNWGLAVGGRRSHLDQAFSRVLDEKSQQYFAIPKYYDGSARAHYQIDASTSVQLGVMASGDEITRRVQSVDPTAQREEARSLYFERVLFRYQSEGTDGSRTTLVPWFGRDRTALVGRFGEVPVELKGDTYLYGLRTNWSGKAADHVTAQVGIDLEMQQSEYHRRGSTSSPSREGDARVFGQPPADQLNTDSWKALTGSFAPYAEADIALFDERTHIVPGLRLEPFLASVNRRRPSEGGPQVGAFDGDLTVQPRLSIRHRFSPRLTLKGAWGVYRQPAPTEDLSSVFGNPLLGTSNATHYLLGAESDLGRNVHVEAAGFLSVSKHLSVRNPLPSPSVAEALVAEGEGRSYGMQVMLRRDLGGGFFGWLAYTLLRSERRLTSSHPWRLFDYDQTHVLTALASYDLGSGFEVGARARVASGYPRTPVTDTYFDSRRDQYEPILGAQNSIRIPYFFQLDARVSKRWTFSNNEIEAYLDVLNTTNQQNPEEIVYNSNYSEKKYINGLPILPVVGLKWSYQ
jgi:TonB family protein